MKIFHYYFTLVLDILHVLIVFFPWLWYRFLFQNRNYQKLEYVTLYSQYIISKIKMKIYEKILRNLCERQISKPSGIWIKGSKNTHLGQWHSVNRLWLIKHCFHNQQAKFTNCSSAEVKVNGITETTDSTMISIYKTTHTSPK